MLVAQLCPTLCDPTGCSLPDYSVHGIFRQECWSGLPCPPLGDLSDPGIEPRSPALQADALTSEPPGKPRTLRDHQKLVGKYLSIPATKKCFSESFCNCFSCSTQHGTGLGREGSRVGGQDRVGSPCVNLLGPICLIQLCPWLHPHGGYL